MILNAGVPRSGAVPVNSIIRALLDLAEPVGPCRAKGIRVMVGYRGDRLVYLDDSYPPEEHYPVLAGSAWFRLGCDPWRLPRSGNVFHTPAGAVQSAGMCDVPLLAVSTWPATDLSVHIRLTNDGRDVVLPGR